VANKMMMINKFDTLAMVTQVSLRSHITVCKTFSSTLKHSCLPDCDRTDNLINSLKLYDTRKMAFPTESVLPRVLSRTSQGSRHNGIWA